MSKLNISHETLFQKCSDLVDLMTEDLEKFKEFGVNEQTIEEFEYLVTDFKKEKYDKLWVARQKQASIDKNSDKGIVRNFLNDLQLKSKLAYDSQKSPIQLIKLGSISTLDAEELCLLAKSYLSIFASRESEIENYGINTDDVFKLEDYTRNLDKNIVSQKTAKIERVLATEIRSAKAYKLFITHNIYCKLGRKMWQGINPARSNQYVIYK